MNSNLKSSDIAVVLHTLNDAHRDLDLMFQSIIKNDIDELIVVDGGSTDGTYEIAKKYTNNVFLHTPGICSQHLYALSKVSKKFVVAAETDHIYPDGLFFLLLNKLINSDHSGIQARLVCDLKNNFFENGQSIFYELLQQPGKILEVPTGPTVWHYDLYFQAISEISKLEGTAGFSIDTVLADYLRQKKMSVLMVENYAFQHETLNFEIFFKKIKSYGKGDYIYFKSHKKIWNLSRKIKSITHVFRRYGFQLPLKSIKIHGLSKFIIFSYAIVLFRYYGFFTELFHDITQRKR